MRIVRLILGTLVAAAILSLTFIFIAWRSGPDHNTNKTHFDTLIVLGNPAQSDGKPAGELAERIDESVREYKAGIAPHVIMTGGAAHNKWVEAQVMADDAVRQGVPRDAIVVEGQAKDTIQNIWFSHQIMDARGWHSAEVISSPYHLPRTAMILQRYTGPLSFEWRTHPAHWPPDYTIFGKLARDYHEAIGVFTIRRVGFRSSNYLPKPE